MVLESGTLPVIPGKEDEFEAAFEQAKSLIAGSPGCISVELRRKVEVPNEYLLLVQWETIEDHTEGFRGSEAFTARVFGDEVEDIRHGQKAGQVRAVFVDGASDAASEFFEHGPGAVEQWLELELGDRAG